MSARRGDDTAIRMGSRRTWLFHLISKFFKRTSLVIWTNLSLAKCAGGFDDPKMIMALLDRLARHCHILKTRSESYRFKKSSAR